MIGFIALSILYYTMKDTEWEGKRTGKIQENAADQNRES